jgi:hypothetical protein
MNPIIPIAKFILACFQYMGHYKKPDSFSVCLIGYNEDGIILIVFTISYYFET